MDNIYIYICIFYDNYSFSTCFMWCFIFLCDLYIAVCLYISSIHITCWIGELVTWHIRKCLTPSDWAKHCFFVWHFWFWPMEHWHASVRPWARSPSDWWFGTFLFFPHIGNDRIPTDFHSIIFQRGRLNHQPTMFDLEFWIFVDLLSLRVTLFWRTRAKVQTWGGWGVPMRI